MINWNCEHINNAVINSKKLVSILTIRCWYINIFISKVAQQRLKIICKFEPAADVVFNKVINRAPFLNISSVATTKLSASPRPNAGFCVYIIP